MQPGLSWDLVAVWPTPQQVIRMWSLVAGCAHIVLAPDSIHLWKRSLEVSGVAIQTEGNGLAGAVHWAPERDGENKDYKGNKIILLSLDSV